MFLNCGKTLINFIFSSRVVFRVEFSIVRYIFVVSHSQEHWRKSSTNSDMFKLTIDIFINLLFSTDNLTRLTGYIVQNTCGQIVNLQRRQWLVVWTCCFCYKISVLNVFIMMWKCETFQQQMWQTKCDITNVTLEFLTLIYKYIFLLFLKVNQLLGLGI